MENYIIYIENFVMGTRLSLDKNNVIGKKYNRWAVEDDFNGLSLPTLLYSEDKDGRLGDYIYGFYKPGSTVTLKFYSKNGKEEKSINNVVILEKKGGNYNV